MTANDLDLLRQFSRDHSQDAFTTLVQRHVNLVYSTALRHVRSRELAEEVAQSVFSDLARNAARLKAKTVLSAWLYQVTRRRDWPPRFQPLPLRSPELPFQLQPRLSEPKPSP